MKTALLEQRTRDRDSTSFMIAFSPSVASAIAASYCAVKPSQSNGSRADGTSDSLRVNPNESDSWICSYSECTLPVGVGLDEDESLALLYDGPEIGDTGD